MAVCKRVHPTKAKRILAALPFGLLLASAPLIAEPGEMKVATFVQKAGELQKMGAAALFSSERKALRAEAQAAAGNYRARMASDRKAGRPPHSCPPGDADLDRDELLAHLRSYSPEAQSRLSIDAAFADLMKKRYPCR